MLSGKSPANVTILSTLGSIAMNSAVSPDMLQDPASAIFSRPVRLSKSYDSDVMSQIKFRRAVGIV
jgi:hypothetical protein